MVVVFTTTNAHFGTRNANCVFPRGQNWGGLEPIKGTVRWNNNNTSRSIIINDELPHFVQLPR